MNIVPFILTWMMLGLIMISITSLCIAVGRIEKKLDERDAKVKEK